VLGIVYVVEVNCVPEAAVQPTACPLNCVMQYVGLRGRLLPLNVKLTLDPVPAYVAGHDSVGGGTKVQPLKIFDAGVFGPGL